jgi:hypothetical protein
LKNPEYSGSYRAEVLEGGNVTKYISFRGKFPEAIELAMSKRGIAMARVELVDAGLSVGALDGKVVDLLTLEARLRVIEVTPEQMEPEPAVDAEPETSETAPRKSRVVHATIGHNVSARGTGKVKKSDDTN